VDKIIIQDLEVQARVGVTVAERAQAQRLLVTIRMERDLATAGRSDDMAATTDYAAVAELIGVLVAERPRNLIESVAHDVAEAILAHKLAEKVTVEVKKLSLPGTRHVAVEIQR
jgi:FolB domain-containing protein